MAALKEIISLIEEIAPLRLAESWDNSGLQIGDPEKEIKKIISKSLHKEKNILSYENLNSLLLWQL